jgi:hypothetical protein
MKFIKEKLDALLLWGEYKQCSVFIAAKRLKQQFSHGG